MAKTTTAAMDTHLAEEVTTLATLWRITREDATEFFFTDHDKDLVFDGNTYIANSAYKRTAIQNDASMSVDNLEVEGIFDSAAITEQELRAGLFDHAQVRVSIVNWNDLTAGEIKMRNGRLGEVRLTTQGFFRAELRGMSQHFTRKVGSIYQPECRADVGDSKCKIPIQPDVRVDSTAYSVGDFVRVATGGATGNQSDYENRIYECTNAGTTAGSAPAMDTTVGNTTTDGTVTWTTRQAWTRHGVVDTVTDRTTFTLTVAFDETRAVDDWFNGGALVFESGDNDARVVEIRNWTQSTRQIELFLPASYTVAAATLVRLYPGCDKRIATCQSKFDMTGTTNFDGGNAKNFRGEPYVPGQDVLISYPDAQ